MMANDAVVRRTKGIKRPQELQISFIMALLRHLSSSLGPTNMKEDTSPKVCILYDNSYIITRGFQGSTLNVAAQI